MAASRNLGMTFSRALRKCIRLCCTILFMSSYNYMKHVTQWITIHFLIATKPFLERITQMLHSKSTSTTLIFSLNCATENSPKENEFRGYLLNSAYLGAQLHLRRKDAMCSVCLFVCDWLLLDLLSSNDDTGWTVLVPTLLSICHRAGHGHSRTRSSTVYAMSEIHVY